MLKNLTVKSRLIFVLSFLSILAVVIGFLGLRGMNLANEGLRTVFEDRLVPAGQLAEVNILTAENLRETHLMLMHDPRLPESKLHDHPLSFHTDKMAENTRKNNALLDSYRATYLTPEEKVLFEEYEVKRKVYQAARTKTLDLIKDGKYAEANASMVKDTGPTFAASRDAVHKLLELQIEVAKETYEHVESAYDVTRNISIGAIVGSLLLAVFIGVMLIRAIMRPLALAQEVAGKIAGGDLTSNIEIASNDEMGKLLTSFKAMQGSIQNLIGDIKASTDTISTASKQIAAGNSDLSQRTEEQASSLEETASSMEELTSTVKQNTENAKQANQLAINASDVAGKGGEVVSKVVVTMDSINESSRKIVDIISVIDGIAFQTNILALNAAVEAARAGEQGRGFAVVAGEVRNLAQRSAAAAKEIKTLIGDSVEKVEGGSKLVAQAGQTMEEIVTSIRRVTDIMSEITAASVEQSQGIEQVNTAIAQMDEVTQQNAALVEEAAAAAESLEEQAQNLSASVATFKVDNSANHAVATREPATARQVSVTEHKAIMDRSRKAIPAHKAAVIGAKPKPRSGANDDGDWKEF